MGTLKHNPRLRHPICPNRRGFHVMDNLREFVDLVVPELQRRGLSKKKYGGRTLRENFND